MVLSGTALPGVSVPPVSGQTGLVLNPRQRPYVVPVELSWTGSGTRVNAVVLVPRSPILVLRIWSSQTRLPLGGWLEIHWS